MKKFLKTEYKIVYKQTDKGDYYQIMFRSYKTLFIWLNRYPNFNFKTVTAANARLVRLK